MKIAAIIIIFQFITIVGFTQTTANSFDRKSNYTFKINEKLLYDEYIYLDTTSKETQNWLYKQETNLIQYKSKLNNQVTYENIKSLNNYHTSSYTILGKYFFKIFYNHTGQGIYKSNSINHADLLIDSKDITENKDKVATFRSMSVSGDMNYLAYTYSINGSDHLHLNLFNLSQQRHLKESLSEVDWKEIQWFKNGFFYSKFDSTSIFYHQLNTDPLKDSMIVPQNNTKSIEQEFLVLNNEKYLILNVKIYNF